MIGDRLMVGCLLLNQAMEVQILLPEPFGRCESPMADMTAGWLLLVATPGSDPGGRWFDSNPRNLDEKATRPLRLAGFPRNRAVRNRFCHGLRQGL